jgi:hypothetical protein
MKVLVQRPWPAEDGSYGSEWKEEELVMPASKHTPKTRRPTPRGIMPEHTNEGVENIPLFALDHHRDRHPWRHAPPWAIEQQKVLLDIRHMLHIILRKEEQMRQSTQDLIDTTAALVATVNDEVVPAMTGIGTAIDALVTAQDSGDAAAVAEQVAALQGLAPTVKGLAPALQAHLPKIAEAATEVVQAPADPNAEVKVD